jgi:ribonucleoside-diphosphate reductase alpha chain
MAKCGSTLSGLLDSLAVTISLGLQHGIPLQVFADKFIDSRYEPLGYTGNPEIPEAQSITDYVFRWLTKKFPAGTIQ